MSNKSPAESTDKGTIADLPARPSANMPPAPPNPKMGRYEESYANAGDWYAISGGKPLPDWSGLDTSASTGTVNPCRYTTCCSSCQESI